MKTTFRVDAWLAETIILPRQHVQDIDTPEDWERAEWLFKAMKA